ncbi:serine hydrolase domain-containing protein [Spirochaeta cellobiosiphila]|uniref:serine hydrolase domain-containing protein n=1 Tax=Spirochaeta cellobiosiphila TaxID=504483 RepID=UPI000415DFE3|nr:serine hydrolase domain-containing protein [Spirochaeta cellobiosiphila]
MKGILSIYLALVLFSCATTTNQPESEIDNLISETVAENNITGLTVSIIHKGKPLLRKGYGYRDYSQQLKVDSNTLFQIGSTTKLFTAIAIMQLVEDDKIILDNDVRMYLPDFKPKSLEENSTVTVRDLLTHHSSLPSAYFRNFVQQELDDTEFMKTSAILGDEYLVKDSPRVFAYNNLGFSLLGEIIATVSQESYEEYIKTHIFNPLGMDRAQVLIHDKNLKNLSKGYNAGEDQELMWFIKDIPAGSILLTNKDMEIFQEELIKCSMGESNRLLSQDSLQRMFVQQNKDVVLDENFEIGLTFWIEHIAGYDVFGHGGTIPPFYSEMKIVPEAGTAVFLASNDNTGNNEVLTDLSIEIIKLLLGTKIDEPKSPQFRPIQKEDISQLSGYYMMGNIGLLHIHDKEGKLVANIPDIIENTEILITEDNVVYLGETGITLHPIVNKYADFIGYQEKFFMGPVTKSMPSVISETWKNRLGTYTSNGLFEELILSYDTKSDLLLMKAQSSDLGTLNVSLDIINDELLRVQGLGRNNGNILEYHQEGSVDYLNYAGIEFYKNNN